VIGRALLDARQRCLVGVQRGQAFFRRGVALIGQIVGAAGEGVDGLHRRTQALGQQNRGDREVFVVIDRHKQERRQMPVRWFPARNGSAILK
jgi:hypothetical protein